jgi:hypothetical protein
VPAAAPSPAIAAPAIIAIPTALKQHMLMPISVVSPLQIPRFSFRLLKKQAKNSISERRIYHSAMSVLKGKSVLRAASCRFFRQLICAGYKFPRENVFVSIKTFMHIGLLLSQRQRKQRDFRCNSLEIINR